MFKIRRNNYRLVCQWFFFIILFLIIFLSYWKNVFHLVNMDWFTTWQADSEWSVWDRIYDDLHYGFTHNAGLLGECKYNDVYTYNPDHNVYTAQMGMQGFVFGFLFKYLNLTQSQLYFTETFVVVACLFALAWWIWKEFGYGTAIVYIVLLFFNHWLTVSARNLYHVVWTMLFPFLSTLFILRYSEKTGKNVDKKLILGGFLSIFIRCACGYEYISLVMINLELPVFYYAFKNRWKWERVLQNFLKLGIASVCAFICSVAGVTIQNNSYLNTGVAEAFQEFLDHALYRTGIGGSEQFEGLVRESLEASRVSILKTYLNEGHPVLFQWNMNVILILILIGILISLIDARYCSEINTLRHKLLSLTVLVLTAFLGPLSWLILAKGHAYIHTHIIYMIWSLPFLLLGEVLVIYSFGIIAVSIVKKNKGIAVAAMAVIAFSEIMLYYDIHFPMSCEYRRVVDYGWEVYANEEDILMYYENKLYYLTNSEDENYYFLHFYETEQSGEFHNSDFIFDDKEMQLPFWYQRRMAKIDLPRDYKIQKIQTGLLDSRRIERIWEITIEQDILNLQGD